jgi:hypothetical protein
MKIKIISLAIFSFIFLLLGCNKEIPAEVIKGNGIVKNINLDGCGYLIKQDNGAYISPTNLASNLQIDGKAIYFEAKIVTDMADACQTGQIVELLKTEELLTADN